MVTWLRRLFTKPRAIHEGEIERWLREQGLSPWAAAEDLQRSG